MISLDEVNKTIFELETQHDTTYNVCEKLAWLYIVRDHVDATRCASNDVSQPAAREMSPESYASEFLIAASNVDVASLLDVLNEHMEVVKLLHPREYESLIKKIRELKKQVP